MPLTLHNCLYADDRLYETVHSFAGTNCDSIRGCQTLLKNKTEKRKQSNILIMKNGGKIGLINFME
jgi:hypothetical protein